MWMKHFRKTLLTALQFKTARGYIKLGLKILFSEKVLFATNSLTSGGCMFMGDLLQQEIGRQLKLRNPAPTNQYDWLRLSAILDFLLEEKQPPNTRYDWLRLKRMFQVGTLLGSLHHFYYVYLDILLPKVTLRNVFLKILADQLFCAPLTIVLFFYLMCYLENKSLEKATGEVKKKMIWVYVGDLLYWPPVQFVNFYYISTTYRLFYINIATMIYNVFLSFMKFDYEF